VKKFHQIPENDFPMKHATYCRLRNEIASISARFSDLGTQEGAAVAKQMEKVHGALGDAWEMLRYLEDRGKHGS
jgi:hypothetical protein